MLVLARTNKLCLFAVAILVQAMIGHQSTLFHRMVNFFLSISVRLTHSAKRSASQVATRVAAYATAFVARYLMAFWATTWQAGIGRVASVSVAIILLAILITVVFVCALVCILLVVSIVCVAVMIARIIIHTRDATLALSQSIAPPVERDWVILESHKEQPLAATPLLSTATPSSDEEADWTATPPSSDEVPDWDVIPLAPSLSDEEADWVMLSSAVPSNEDADWMMLPKLH